MTYTQILKNDYAQHIIKTKKQKGWSDFDSKCYAFVNIIGYQNALGNKTTATKIQKEYEKFCETGAKR